MNKLNDLFCKRSGSTCRMYAASSMMHCVILTAFLFVLSFCSKDDSFYRVEGNIIGHYYGLYEENIIFGIFIETDDSKKYACFNLSHNDIFDESIGSPLRVGFCYEYNSIQVNFQFRNASKQEMIDIEILYQSMLAIYFPLRKEEMKEYKQIIITQLNKN